MQGSNLQQIIRLTLLNNMVGCHFSHFFQVWPANCECSELGSIREAINYKMIRLKDLGIQIESCMPYSCIYTLRIDNWAVSQIGDHKICKLRGFLREKYNQWRHMQKAIRNSLSILLAIWQLWKLWKYHKEPCNLTKWKDKFVKSEYNKSEFIILWIEIHHILQEPAVFGMLPLDLGNLLRNVGRRQIGLAKQLIVFLRASR